MLNDKEKRVVRLVQGDIPLEKEPFKAIAEGAGMEEEEVMSILKDLTERGIIRRFGATLYHREAGIKANAMVVWKVPEGDVERVGKIIASFREVTHCYQRPPFEGFPYNLYTMIHASTREGCEQIAGKMGEASGIKEYELHFSLKEFKKTSMRYFEENEKED